MVDGSHAQDHPVGMRVEDALHLVERSDTDRAALASIGEVAEKRVRGDEAPAIEHERSGRAIEHEGAVALARGGDAQRLDRAPPAGIGAVGPLQREVRRDERENRGRTGYAIAAPAVESGGGANARRGKRGQEIMVEDVETRKSPATARTLQNHAPQNSRMFTWAA